MRHVVYSAWRVFCSCLFKALGRAYSRHGFKVRHVLFRTDGVVLNKDGAKEDGNDRS